jgi:hypothetical protein
VVKNVVISGLSLYPVAAYQGYRDTLQIDTILTTPFAGYLYRFLKGLHCGPQITKVSTT